MIQTEKSMLLLSDQNMTVRVQSVIGHSLAYEHQASEAKSQEELASLCEWTGKWVALDFHVGRCP